MIAYKVVRRGSRLSCGSGLGNKYVRKYENNSIVEAEENTLGLFLFKECYEAIEYYNAAPKLYQVLVVETLSEIITPSNMCTFWYNSNEYLDYYYNDIFEIYGVSLLSSMYPNTICCHIIKVIKEIN